jgi:asparagine synthase (glutamine-hydrolysing)
MSYIFKTEHYEMVLKAGDMERALPRLAWHLEEPRVGQSYPNFYISQLASKFNKVVLAGTGGDEIFGGYPWRYYRAVVNQDFEQYVDKYYSTGSAIPTKLVAMSFSQYGTTYPMYGPATFSDLFSVHANVFTRPEVTSIIPCTSRQDISAWR